LAKDYIRCDACKYLDCTHINEPDCEIKRLIDENKLSSDRHQRYIEILQEIKTYYGGRYGNKKY
jgi:ribosome biogenesis GTPase